MITYYNPYELYHHGIKGQKWGVRRFQNRDGTYTSAGRARYDDGSPHSKKSGIEKKADLGKRRTAKNYTEEQRMRDARIYGKRAVRRINERMLNGESISGARSAEADRINKFRNYARYAGIAGKVYGSVSGAVKGVVLGKRLAGVGEKLVYAAFQNTELPGMPIIALKATTTAAVGIGMSKAGASLGKLGGQSIVMLLGGYSPSKYRE